MKFFIVITSGEVNPFYENRQYAAIIANSEEEARQYFTTQFPALIIKEIKEDAEPNGYIIQMWYKQNKGDS